MKSKAIFLLVIFLLNTIVGFGCALGMEEDHHDENHSHESAHHVHGDYDHHHSDGHEHQANPISGLNFSRKDSCCKTLVNNLLTQSKLIPQSGKTQIILPVMWLADYACTSVTPVIDLEINQRNYVDRRERPPDKDIRIVIQSFQI